MMLQLKMAARTLISIMNKDNKDKNTAHKLRLLTFDVLGHVVVKNHGDVVDIDTSTSNVCGHQDIFGSCFEVGERKLSLFLAFSTVQRTSIVLCEEEPTEVTFCLYINSISEHPVHCPGFKLYAC